MQAHKTKFYDGQSRLVFQILSRVLVTRDAGLDRWVDLLDIH
jgi:hypothetical protein